VFASSHGSHRSRAFVAQFQQVRGSLSELAGGVDVALLVGSGTLANDVVAATLAADRNARPGIVLANGEFGQRLAGHAKRMGLAFRLLQWPWGRQWDLDQVVAALRADRRIGWIWGVHLETSTGVLNDLPELVQIGQAHGVRVCADCVSSLGAAPLDLRYVYLASGTAGKALGAYAGLAIVFAAPCITDALDRERIPVYLDLASALHAVGPRFTFPSPQLHALERALEAYATAHARRARFEHYAELGRCVRSHLRALGIEPLADEAYAAPTVTSFAVPRGRSSEEFVELCARWGYRVGGLSSYLAQRRWAQIATMGAVSLDDCRGLFGALKDSLFQS
jgi:aspartate aminotransferase-like enzyme